MVRLGKVLDLRERLQSDENVETVMDVGRVVRHILTYNLFSLPLKKADI